ncbi:DNA sulfur modification protein DndB [Kineococcus sp. SYSU DK004]|uniref:DNA sulfur modification protein DndB n=1 Tax=Kineococcus sp. SYSU DK004 TaxID=3383125 RepID=UPI003D7DFA34
MPTGLSELQNVDLLPTRYEGVGFAFSMGQLQAIQIVVPIQDVVAMAVDQVVKRDDYELDGEDPGNRLVNKPHVRKIKDGLHKHADKLLMGTFIFATSPDAIVTKKVLGDSGGSGADIKLVTFGIRSGHSLFILDAQHRNEALGELWNETLKAVKQGDLEAEQVAAYLKKSSVPILIVLENNRDEISRMFVTLASTKPISPSLIAVMDRESLANRLGLAVAKEWALLGNADRLAFQTSTASGEMLYSAAQIRGATASIFVGFRDRSPDIREAALMKVVHELGQSEEQALVSLVAEAVDLLDYAYERIPGWKDMASGAITPAEFRAQYVHGSAAGLYVIAGIICAARLSSGVDPKAVIDALATDFEWRKDKVVDGQHPSFNDTLVVVEPQLDEGQVVGYKTRTGGGNRTTYEKATRRALGHLSAHHDEFAELTSPVVLGELGLAARPGEKRGRPRATVISA